MLPPRALSISLLPRIACLPYARSTSRSLSMASPFSRAVVRSMRQLYPECLADKSFDNTGLLLEAPYLPARRNKNSALLTIDLTKAVAEEAIEGNHSVVVSYHPIIFRGLKSMTLDDSQQQSLLKLAAHGVSVYSPHTAVDVVPGGMGDWLCDIVTGKLDEPEPQVVAAESRQSDDAASDVDLTTTAETTDDEGANQADQKVEFSTPPPEKSSAPPATNGGPVTPKPAKRSRPLAHRTYSRPSYPSAPPTFHPGSLDHSRTIISTAAVSDVDSANTLTSSTAYSPTNTGSGRLITFAAPQPITLLITRIAHAIGLPKGFPIAIPQGVNIDDIHITTVGVCPGSGASVMRNCKTPPDLVFTGEMSHHEALAVTERGGSVISLFHSNSERGYLSGVMQKQLHEKVTEVWKEERERVKKEIANGRLKGGCVVDGIEEICEDETVEVVVSERDRDPFGIVVLMESEVEGRKL